MGKKEAKEKRKVKVMTESGSAGGVVLKYVIV